MVSIEKILENVNSVVVGKENTVKLILTAMLAEGHVLIEDVPGVGKTTFANAFAKTFDCSFSRIQFTPDTMPGDVIGSSIYNFESHEFEYVPGAIMGNIILADEINRAPAKVQSALLEAMAERQVTVGATTYVLPELFLVMATQNPIEFMGTYQLPEAQTDRFMMKLNVGYPDADEELRMVRNMLEGKYSDTVESVITAKDVVEIRKKVCAITIKEDVIGYARNIADLTRNEKRFVLGVSPRAVLALVKASQAKAFLEGRDFVKPDDVKAVAKQVLGHRLSLSPEARIAKENKDKILENLIRSAKIPY